MSRHSWTKEEAQGVADLLRGTQDFERNLAAVEAFLGFRPTRAQVDAALRTKLGAGLGPLLHERVALAPEMASVVVEPPPPPGLLTEELLEDRVRRFERKRAHEEARKLVAVTVQDDLPIGILHFGDPHLDDDGTDIRLVREHLRLLKTTPGLYGANVGDTTNNWIGRLARLYEQQTTSSREAWQLAQWFIGEGAGRWLYLVGGNHDLWSGAGDPLRWISAQASALYQDSEVRVAIRFPNGREVRVNCRHDFNGKSQWNPAHGPMKALFLGVRDHLAIAGHMHESAYGLLKDPDSGITMHAVKVASYKTYDRYAREKNLRDQNLSPCALTVIDPRLPPTHPDLLKVYWDPAEGADFLTWTRGRRRAA